MTQKRFDKLPGLAQDVNLSGEPVGPTYIDYGREVAPAAGKEIAAIEGIESGFYDVQGWVGFGATVAAGDEDNFALVTGGSTISSIIAAPVANQPLGNINFHFPRVRLPQGKVQIVAPAAGTAGAIYKAMLAITQVS